SMTTGSDGVGKLFPSRPELTKMITFSNPPSLTTTCSVYGSLFAMAQYGSALIWILSGLGAVPSKLIFPPTVPVRAGAFPPPPPPGGGGGVVVEPPPPQDATTSVKTKETNNKGLCIVFSRI